MDRAGFTGDFVFQALGNEWHPESEEYIKRLVSEGYTSLPMLMSLTEEDLKFCGIEKRAHVRGFLLLVQKLQSKEMHLVSKDSQRSGYKRPSGQDVDNDDSDNDKKKMANFSKDNSQRSTAYKRPLDVDNNDSDNDKKKMGSNLQRGAAMPPYQPRNRSRQQRLN